MKRTWPQDWEARKRGVGCPFCADLTGRSFHSGRVSEALLERHAIAEGHVAVVFRPRHVATFTDLADAEASAFFEPGSVGYSATASGRRLDGVVLKTHSWSVAPLAIERVSSTYFADETVFPAGTVTFDCALIIRNIAHEWQAGAPMYI